MLNIVEKYSAETPAQSEEGVVAIEYVMVAGAVVAALLAIFVAFGTTLTDQARTTSSTGSTTAPDSDLGGRATSPPDRFRSRS